MFIGNEKIVEFFEKAITNGSLAHAYCFIGSDGVGKRTLAQILASQLLQTTVDKLTSNPDFYLLERFVDEKTEKLKKDISVAQVRDLRSKLQSRSWSGGYQVAIIDEAEKMNEEASNALLKILEEPGEKTVFFLITSNDEALPNTIRSRCQTFYFASPSSKDLKIGLNKIGFEDEKIKNGIELVGERTGMLINLLNDQELYNNLINQKERWQNFFKSSPYKSFKLLEKYLGDKKELADGVDTLIEELDNWQIWERQNLLENKNDFSAKMIDKISQAKILLRKNINPKLILEEILLNN